MISWPSVEAPGQAWNTHVCHPTEQVGMEAYMVLRHIETTMDKNVLRESAAVICGQYVIRNQLPYPRSSSPLHPRLETWSETLRFGDC